LFSKISTINNNNIESEDDDEYEDDDIIIENDIEIDWDFNKQNMINSFSSFRNFVNKKNKTNIFVIINKFLEDYYNDSLEKLKENKFGFVKYLYFLKKEFDNEINNETISKMISKTYISKIRNIRYIVIFYDNQHPLYIYDLQLNKIIDIQKCKILYQIKNPKFKCPFNISMIINLYNYYNNFLIQINILIM
jgi:hypothetical protein